MIRAKIDFACKLCGQKDRWYIMPLELPTQSNDFIYSTTTHKLMCKGCRKTYILDIKIRDIRLKGRN